jgi:hypothetical protein
VPIADINSQYVGQKPIVGIEHHRKFRVAAISAGRIAWTKRGAPNCPIGRVKMSQAPQSKTSEEYGVSARDETRENRKAIVGNID